jgi:hypothetical protein
LKLLRVYQMGSVRAEVVVLLRRLSALLRIER